MMIQNIELSHVTLLMERNNLTFARQPVEPPGSYWFLQRSSQAHDYRLTRYKLASFIGAGNRTLLAKVS